MIGQIAKLNYDKNYGYIKTDKEKKKIFFHKADLTQGLVFGTLKKGQKVRFFVEETKKGKKATHIIIA